jgi:hypothetical protein
VVAKAKTISTTCQCRLSFAAKVMDLTYAQAADIEPMMKEIAIMTDLRHDNIVRYIGSDCNMAKKEVRHHHSCLCLRLCVCVFVCLCL